LFHPSFFVCLLAVHYYFLVHFCFYCCCGSNAL